MPRGGCQRGKRAIDLTEEEIRRVYVETDLGLDAACKVIQCSKKILIQALRMYGIPSKPRGKIGAGRPPVHSHLADHDWLKGQIKIRTFKSIAKQLGVSEAVVRGYVIRHGLYEKYETVSEAHRAGARKSERKTKYDKITANDIRRVYLDTAANTRKAARDLGVSYPTLIKAMDEFGIARKSHGRKTRRWTANSKDFPELDNPDWLKGEIQLHSKKHIATMLGTTVWNVDFHVRKHGLTSWETPYVPVENLHELPRRRDREYMRVFLPLHPYANPDGYVYEHRVVLENKLGRYLGPDEIGHHVNERKQDNRPENLEALTREEHARLHYQENANAKKELERVKAELEALKASQHRTARKVDRLIADNQFRLFEEPREMLPAVHQLGGPHEDAEITLVDPRKHV